MAALCAGCRALLSPRARFCEQCGKAVAARTPESAPPPPPPGGGIGLPPRYEVVKFLGSGAMGRVYRCRDTELDVEVAVKILLPEVSADESAVDLIHREARAAARLRECPGILHLYGLERFGTAWYLVMEYAAEGTLEERMKKWKRLSEEECRRIGAEVAEALAFAHGLGILHRDIKPANILFSGGGRAKVADFGLARLLESGKRPRAVTKVGTPNYMAPEIKKREAADGRADLFSLGCSLYEAATGERAYPSGYGDLITDPADLLALLPDPREKRPDLSEEFATILRCLIHPDPRARFPDGHVCAAALRRPVEPPGETTV